MREKFNGFHDEFNSPIMLHRSTFHWFFQNIIKIDINDNLLPEIEIIIDNDWF